MILDQVEVLKVERVRGENGENKWDFTRVHVLDDVVVHQCRVSDDWPVTEPLVVGNVISAEVAVNAFVSRSHGPQVGIRLERPVSIETQSLRASASQD